MAKDTKQKILVAARDAFSRNGFDGCSVDEIAARAGVNKASLYYHFGDKASLYDRVLTDNLDNFLQRVRQAVAVEKDPQQKLAAFIRAYGENFAGNRAMAPLMLRELASDGIHLSDAVKEKLDDIILEVDAILEYGRRGGIFREAKTFITYIMLVGSMNIFSSTTNMRRRFEAGRESFGFSLSTDEAAEEIAAIVLHGLNNS